MQMSLPADSSLQPWSAGFVVALEAWVKFAAAAVIFSRPQPQCCSAFDLILDASLKGGFLRDFSVISEDFSEENSFSELF